MNDEKTKATRLCQTAQGQINAVLKMLDEDRYCVDISNQILAAQALLKKANLLILKQHMTHCVIHAIEHGDAQEKIDEVLNLVDRMVE